MKKFMDKISSSPLGAITSKSSNKKNAGQAPSSPTTHTSSRSIDVPPKSQSSLSPSATNSVKLVSSRDEAEAEDRLPMPQPVSSFTPSEHTQNEIASKSTSLGRGESSASVQAQANSSSLPLKSAPNGTHKPYNMSGPTADSQAVTGAAPAANGSYSSNDRLPLPQSNRPLPLSTVRTISGQFGGSKSYSNLRGATEAPSQDAPPVPEWSAAVGGAASGKSGRVIEKIMGERDALKRENNSLKMQNTELLEFAKMAKERADEAERANEADKHENQIAQTMLNKRDRQLLDYKERVDVERRRADAAIESERTWKASLDKIQAETQSQIEEANARALAAEAQCKILAKHWPEQKADLARFRAKVVQENRELLASAIIAAENLEQRNQVSALIGEKLDEVHKKQAEQAQRFKDYATDIDKSLDQLKVDANKRVAQADELEAEAKETIDKMKWAINVKKNVKDADINNKDD